MVTVTATALAAAVAAAVAGADFSRYVRGMSELPVATVSIGPLVAEAAPPPGDVFLEVLLDTGVWVFAVGASVIGALAAVVLAHRFDDRHIAVPSSLAGGTPVGLLVLVFLTSSYRDGIDFQLAFLLDPANMFAFAIWFGFGWIAAYWVVKARRRSLLRKKIDLFE